MKKAYNLFNESKSNTYKDDVGQGTEYAAMNGVENKLDLPGQDENDASEEELFIPLRKPLASQRRRSFVLVDGVHAEGSRGQIVGDDQVDIIQDQEFQVGCTQEKLPNKRVEQNEIGKGVEKYAGWKHYKVHTR